MTTAAALTPGRVYRTSELRAFTANPSRWAKRLVAQGALMQAHHGLYYVPTQTNFGAVGPRSEDLIRAYLGSDDFLITGPYFWNALGLGTTQMFAVTLVYNHERTGETRLGGGRYWFRRVRFPAQVTKEWLVVDLYNNERHMGEDTSRMDELLTIGLRRGRFDAERLARMAEEYGHSAERERILAAIRGAGA